MVELGNKKWYTTALLCAYALLNDVSCKMPFETSQDPLACNRR